MGSAWSNLFIYHFPHDLTDANISLAFNQFGNIISVKVYLDCHAGDSQGFSFVLKDSAVSSKQAMDQMNGFQIGYKSLKVQHNRVHHNDYLAGGGGGDFSEGGGEKGG